MKKVFTFYCDEDLLGDRMWDILSQVDVNKVVDYDKPLYITQYVEGHTYVYLVYECEAKRVYTN